MDTVTVLHHNVFYFHIRHGREENPATNGSVTEYIHITINEQMDTLILQSTCICFLSDIVEKRIQPPMGVQMEEIEVTEVSDSEYEIILTPYHCADDFPLFSITGVQVRHRGYLCT